MAPLPDHRPDQLSLGPLESEILDILWELDGATGKDIHDRLLADPDRELAYPSVMTVLRRLEKKGWVTAHRSKHRHDRAIRWQPQVSRQEARMILAHDQLQQFLSISNPDIVAAFADSLDAASVEQIEAIARRIQAVRRAREGD